MSYDYFKPHKTYAKEMAIRDYWLSHAKVRNMRKGSDGSWCGTFKVFGLGDSFIHGYDDKYELKQEALMRQLKAIHEDWGKV
jgi:hypothetical protein